MKPKKKEHLKANSNQIKDPNFAHGQLRQTVLKSQQANYEQVQQNTQQSLGNQGGVSYVKQVASKGATGRKGSLPLNYNDEQISSKQHAQQQNVIMRNSIANHRSSQQHIQNQPIETNMINQLAVGHSKGINKSIKSHAKYFSQQNSPVSKDHRVNFHPGNQHQLGGNGQGGIVLSTSGAGIVGVDNQFAAQNARQQTNQATKQTSHQNTGNFGSNPSNQMISSLPNESRHIKNYSQISQQSNGSQMQNLKHIQYMQQILQNEQNDSNKAANSNKLMNPTHMKQVHSLGGPVLSQFAGNQTIQSNGSISNTNPTQQTFNASINKPKQTKQADHGNVKHQYEESYLNAPMGGTQKSKNNEPQSLQQAKRVINNQSQQHTPNVEMQMHPQIYGNHKRMMSSQLQQIPTQQPPKEIMRSSTATGQYPQQSGIDPNYNQKQLNNLKSSVLSQHSNKLQMEKSQEIFSKSGQQLNFINTNSIVLNATRDSVGMKQIKNKIKSQTRPNSNQKIKSNQIHGGSFVKNEGFAIHQAQQHKTKPKTSGTTKSQQSSVIERNQQKRFNESQQVKKSSGFNQTHKHNQIQQIYGKEPSMMNGSQNIVYYGGNGNIINSPNEMHVNPSHGNIPVLQGSASQQNKQQQVVTVPQTMLHKTNKIMNNYLKQGQMPNSEQQIFNKRLSTDQLMQDKDGMNMSLKKQGYHQRAETQLKNPQNQGLLGMGPQQEMMGNNTSNHFYAQQPVNSQQLINTQVQFNHGKQLGIVLNPNQKFANSKSQKSSTSRLINQHTNSQSGKFSAQYHKAQTNFQGSNNQIQNSADRIAISQRSDQAMFNDQHQHIHSVNENYEQLKHHGIVGGAITTNSSKQLINPQQKNQKLGNILQRGEQQYPYQSNSTKSGNAPQSQTQKNNLSIAQIFQQKGLSYKGPSKLTISSNQCNTHKLQSKMGPNGVIVHTKNGMAVKGSLTTSANTAQNSPRQMLNKYGGNYNQHSGSNNPSIRKKPSTASIQGSQSAATHKKSSSNKFTQQVNNSNLRTTSHGGIFKKVNSHAPSANESPLYNEEIDVTEIQNFDEHGGKLDEEQISMLASNGPKKHRTSKSGAVKSQLVGNTTGAIKKQLIIGTQPSTQYIADNGGTGSNPNQNQGLHHRHISQHDFYSQNVQNGKLINNQIPQKKNQHSNSLGSMQQLELMRAKHLTQASGPHPTPKMEKQSSQPSMKSTSIKHHKQQPNIGDIVLNQQLDIIDDEFNHGPMITEEEEQEIKHIASDINEKAFYGKILKTKKAIIENKDLDKSMQKLSPRSKEIAYVMKEVHKSFRSKGEAPETDINYYRVGKMLGRGAFGKVNLAMHKLVRKLVALKSLNKECLTDEVQKHKLMKEVNLLLRMRNDHVVKIYETIETKKHIIIVMELCAGGDLLNYVRKRRRLKEPFAKKIFKQIIIGLQYIHSKFVGHRDIKLDNILLDGKGQVKIADFGVSKQCTPGQKMREQCGTPAYIAPEILKNKNGYSFGVDLWSAGVVLFAMLYGTVPFKAASMEELHSLILRGIYTLKDDISQEARDMLRGLLEINPYKRLTVDKILAHPWLKDCDMTLQLFNDTEREMIKKEYTYNDPSRYNRNENEEPVDCFTEHNIDSVYNTLKNASEKSIILAPFNSTQSEDFEMFKKRIQPEMYDKNLVMRLSRLCREIDRQYEFNNNGQLDNGVYHKQVNNTAENDSGDDMKGGDKKDKKKKKQESDDDDDEARFQIVQCSQTLGEEFLTEDFSEFKLKDKNGVKASRVNELLALHQSTMGTRDTVIDHEKVEKLVQFGYPYDVCMENLQENLPNYLTAGYYLLQMDQNYC